MAAVSASLPIQPQRPSFVFVNNTNLHDAKSQAKRKVVRAQAARCTRAADGSTSNGVVKSSNEPITTKQQSSKRTKKQRTRITLSLNLASPKKPDAPPSKPKGKITAKDEGVSVTVEDKGIEPDVPKLSRKTTNNSSTSSSSHTLVEARKSLDEKRSPIITLITRNPGTGWAAPFVSQPDPEKAYIPMLTDHFLRNMAVQIPELDAGTPFILRKKFFPMMLTSPATFYIILLIAASHYAAFNNLLPNPHTRQILLHIRQKALTSLNKLISDTPPGEPLPDTVIAAVIKMANYESFFGSPSLYHTHMRGLQNMVKGRGGLQTLGLDGLLMRMILWVDVNSAFILNKPAYFSTDMPLAGHVGEMQPSPGRFLCNLHESR